MRLISISAATVLALPALAEDPSCTLVTSVQSGSYTEPTRVSDAGVVIGYNGLAGQTWPWVWREGVGLTSYAADFQSLNAEDAWFFGITGQYVVGHMKIDGDFHAMRWADDGDWVIEAGELLDIHPFGADTSTQAFGVNALGYVTGRVNPPGGDETVFVYNGAIVEIPVLASVSAFGLDINTGGQVAGWLQSPADPQFPCVIYNGFRWSDDGLDVIPQLPGPWCNVQTTAINSFGQVAGSADRASGIRAPILWLGSSAYGLPAGVHDVSPLAINGYANDINDTGVMVGRHGAWPAYRAAAWYPNGDGSFTMIDLNDHVDTGTVTLEEAVAINNSGRIACRGDDNFTYVLDCTFPNPDKDGDGILDVWETQGGTIDINGDGTPDLDLFNLPGVSNPDPNRKDIYVELDAMTGITFPAAAQQLVIDAFEAAPVSNPSGPDGITLHILVDHTSLNHVETWPVAGGCWPSQFFTTKATYFGTAAELASPNSEFILQAKARIFRYCIACDELAGGAGGCGELFGNDFVIAIGPPQYDDRNKASVFMHELGHNLGLDHGGGDAINAKPNYPSIMNYALSYEMPWSSAFWQLDYSHEALPTIDESGLDETAGIESEFNYTDFRMPYAVWFNDGGGVNRFLRYVRLDGSPTDFGAADGSGFQDGEFTLGVVQDLNYLGDANVGGDTLAPSPGDVMVGHDDWANIEIPINPFGVNYANGGTPITAEGEMTLDELIYMSDNFPIPPGACPEDLTGDGAVNVADLLIVLNGWGTPGGDVTGDGTTNVADLLAVLSVWGPCG